MLRRNSESKLTIEKASNLAPNNMSGNVKVYHSVWKLVPETWKATAYLALDVPAERNKASQLMRVLLHQYKQHSMKYNKLFSIMHSRYVNLKQQPFAAIKNCWTVSTRADSSLPLGKMILQMKTRSKTIAGQPFDVIPQNKVPSKEKCASTLVNRLHIGRSLLALTETNVSNKIRTAGAVLFVVDLYGLIFADSLLALLFFLFLGSLRKSPLYTVPCAPIVG